eukprot:scaffold736_cov254-Pinguiococcus_pyrenoidosus.AAC.11
MLEAEEVAFLKEELGPKSGNADIWRIFAEETPELLMEYYERLPNSPRNWIQLHTESGYAYWYGKSQGEIRVRTLPPKTQKGICSGEGMITTGTPST